MKRSGVWLAGLAVLAVAVGFVTLRPEGDVIGSPSPVVVSYRPAATVPRAVLQYQELAEIGMVRDFDGDGGRLYLLDPLNSQVHIAVRDSGGWQRAASFGRRGGGPGEFAMPTGIALLRDPARVAVVEPGRLHYFSPDGTYQESLAPRGLCDMQLPRVAAATSGVFVHGMCAVGDSLFEVLFWSADGREFQQVAQEFRSRARDLGAVYGATNPLGAGLTQAVFAAGVTGCFTIVTHAAPPATRRQCLDDYEQYRLEFRPETLRDMKERRARSRALSDVPLPDRHPAFVHAVVLGRGPVWLRSWEEDSLVVRELATGQDLAVVPYTGLVGCRPAGCLWSSASMDGVRIAFATGSVLAGSR